MCVNYTAQGEDNAAATSRRLRVPRELRENDDPQLWGEVSSLVLDNRHLSKGMLDLDGVIRSSFDLEAVEWILTSTNDVRSLR